MLPGSGWRAWRSGNRCNQEGPLNGGVPNGAPVPHDFDMDGRDDPCAAVGNTWHVWMSRSNHAPAAPFGFDPGVPGPRVPIAFSLTLFPNTHQAYTFMSGDNWAKRGPFALSSGNAPGVAAMVWQDTNGCYAAASVYDIGELTNALVDINGTRLKYNEALSLNPTNGKAVSLRLPFYYAALTNVQAGDAVTLSVYTNGAAGPVLMCRSRPTVLPEQVLLLEPPAGARGGVRDGAGRAIGRPAQPRIESSESLLDTNLPPGAAGG